MITVDARGIEEVQRRLESLAREQIPYATMLAINETAFAVRGAVQDEMKRVFDRPKPWTINQVRVRKATKTKLVAVVGTLEGIKGLYGENAGFSATSSGVYEQVLTPHIESGERFPKRSETRLRRAGILPEGWIVVPGPGMPLDAYGNAKSSEMLQVLSWLNALQWSSQGSTQNRAEKVRKRRNAAEKRGEEYFAVGRTSGKALGANYRRPGVYRRFRDGRVIAMLFFISRYSYKSTLDWSGIVKRTADRVMPAAADRAIARAIETAR